MFFFKNKKKKATKYKLTVPPQDDFENPRTIIDPSELESWLSNLPLANQCVAIKDILTELKLINRYPKKIPQRKKLIEKFEHSHQTFFLIARNLNKRSSTAVLTKKEAEYLVNFSLLNKELAYGYKGVINHELDTLSLKKITPLAFIKTMWLLENEMVFSYMDLTKNQAIIWKEVLEIYKITEELKLSEIKIDTHNEEIGVVAIADFFKKILLFQLADPYRMQATEIWDLMHFIKTRIALTKLIENHTKALTSEQVFVDMRGIIDVLTLARRSKETVNNQAIKIFDMTSIIEETYQIIELINSYTEEHIPADLRHIPTHKLSMLLKKMLITWQLRPKRNSKRIEQYSQIEISSGLTSIYASLKGSKKEDLENDEYLFDEVKSQKFIKQATLSNSFDARQVNISSTGMGGEVEADKIEGYFHVGQLVLVKDKSHPKNKMLGVIKRLYPKSNTVVGFGIELLKGVFQPITYRLDGVASDDFIEKGVVLKQENTKKQLIAPLNTFSPNLGILVNPYDDPVKYKSIKLVESSEYFQRIEIKSKF